MQYFDKAGKEIKEGSFLKYDYGDVSHYACVQNEKPKQVGFWHGLLYFTGDKLDKPLYPDDTKKWILVD